MLVLTSDSFYHFNQKNKNVATIFVDVNFVVVFSYRVYLHHILAVCYVVYNIKG